MVAGDGTTGASGVVGISTDAKLAMGCKFGIAPVGIGREPDIDGGETGVTPVPIGGMTGG